MLQLNAPLIAIAGEFTGKYAPYQAIEITPAKDGGVFVASTDKGNIACLGFDPGGSGDSSMRLLPTPELLRACRGIKTAERSITLGGDGIPASCPPTSAQAPNTAIVTTHRKSTNDRLEIPIQQSSVEFPPLAQTMASVLKKWGINPKISANAGRYDANYMQKAIKSLSSLDTSITFSCFDGGPMRLQTQEGNVVVLVMPQTAEPIPPIPDWLEKYSRSHS
jgi:hypothetical protein